MTVHNFKSSEIEALIECWNRALPHDTVNKSTFIKKMLLDVNFDPEGFFVVKNDEGRIVGLINCVYRKVEIDGYSKINDEEAWISAIAIDSEEHFEKIGDTLLDCAHSYFIKHGKSDISTGYSPVYFFQGVSEEHCPRYIELFKKHGYSTHPSLARDINLSTYVQPLGIEEKKRVLADDGIYIGPMKDDYIYSLIDPRESFNGSVAAFEFKLRLSELDYERIRIAAKDGHIIGVCLFGDPMGSPERFGPFVVSSQYRGRGIGTVLLHECLGEMKKRGLHCAWMQWTPPSGAADVMYKKVGFQVTKTYVRFAKKL